MGVASLGLIEKGNQGRTSVKGLRRPGRLAWATIIVTVAVAATACGSSGSSSSSAAGGSSPASSSAPVDQHRPRHRHRRPERPQLQPPGVRRTAEGRHAARHQARRSPVELGLGLHPQPAARGAERRQARDRGRVPDGERRREGGGSLPEHPVRHHRLRPGEADRQPEEPAVPRAGRRLHGRLPRGPRDEDERRLDRRRSEDPARRPLHRGLHRGRQGRPTPR